MSDILRTPAYNANTTVVIDADRIWNTPENPYSQEELNNLYIKLVQPDFLNVVIKDSQCWCFLQSKQIVFDENENDNSICILFEYLDILSTPAITKYVLALTKNLDSEVLSISITD